VLILGATGETGRLVVPRVGRAHEVRVLSRSADRARERLGSEVEVIEGDVRDRESLAGVADGVDAVISAVGTRTYFGANGGAMVDAAGARNVAAEAARAGVGQLVLLSAFGLDRRSVFLSAFSLALNRYFHWKAEAERAVRESGVPYTIVRPVELRNRAPRAPTRLNQTAPLTLLRTVSREAVAEVLSACVAHPDALHKTFEVCEDTEAPPLDEQLGALAVDNDRALPSRTPLC